MDTERIWQLLARGGLSQNGIRVGGPGPGPLTGLRIPKYNGLSDPAGAEELGRLLADRARAYSPTAVVLWEDPEDIVLGHVVARELGVPAVRSYNEEGLIELIGSLPPASRVLLLTDAFREPGLVRAMRSIVERYGGAVAATAVLADTDALTVAGDVAGSVISLVSIRGDERETEGSSGNGTR